MGISKHFQSAALALLAFSVAALYGIALGYPAAKTPGDVASRGDVEEWVSLPHASPRLVASRAPLRKTVRPDFEAVDAAYSPGIFTVSKLRDRFEAVSFDLEAVREGEQPVPRLYTTRLPRDFKTLARADDIKRTFIQTVLPLALKVNEEILAERHRLLLLDKKIITGHSLSKQERDWLSELAARYDVSADNVSELLRRVDIISPALALAQSAEESGWGRSRFAMKGNALFGQRSWTEGTGIVPHEREQGGRYEVRAFGSLLDSVRSYARNLNRHPAYEDFRMRRAEMRLRDGGLDPYDLVDTLIAYSERREEYVETIEKILRIDNLEELEDTQLENRSAGFAQLALRLSLR